MLERPVFKNRKSLSIISIVIMLLGGLSACTQDTSLPINSQTPVTIGVSQSTSGNFVSDSAATLQGYQLWVDTVNKNGGLLGRQVKLVILPDDSTQQKVQDNYKKLITVDHVNLLFGPFSSLLTIPASQTAHELGYAMLEGSGGGPKVFNRGLNNVFDVSLPVLKNLDTFVYFILSLPTQFRPKTVAYATENDDPFTQPQVDRAKALLDVGQVKMVSYQAYSAQTTKNYVPYADAIIRAHPDIVVLGTLLPDLTAFMQRFKQNHFNPQALIATAGPGDGTTFVKAVGLPNSEAVFVPNGWYPQGTFFQNAQMVQDYLAQYGGTAQGINADVAEAFSAGQVMQQAVDQIHSIDNAKLITELHSSNGLFATVQGPVHFDQFGENTSAQSYLFQWQHGNFLPVYPDSVAAENPEFPRPAIQ